MPQMQELMFSPIYICDPCLTGLMWGLIKDFNAGSKKTLHNINGKGSSYHALHSLSTIKCLGLYAINHPEENKLCSNYLIFQSTSKYVKENMDKLMAVNPYTLPFFMR